MRALFPVWLAVGLSLAGCERSEDAGKGSEKVATPADLTVPAIDSSLPDYARSLSDYIDLNAEPSGLVLSFLAFGHDRAVAGERSQAELLQRLSPEYANTLDEFDRREVAGRIWPEIEAKLEEYATTRYVKLPLGGDLRQVVALNPLTLGAFNFEYQAFPLLAYGPSCWDGVVRNGGGAALRVIGGDMPCFIPVVNRDQAQRIEAARAKGSLQIRGVLYLYVQQISGLVVTASPVRYQLDFLDIATGVNLGTVTL